MKNTSMFEADKTNDIKKEVNKKIEKIFKILATHIPDLEDSKSHQVISEENYKLIFAENQLIAAKGSKVQKILHLINLYTFYFKSQILEQEGLSDNPNIGLCVTFIKYFNSDCGNIIEEIQAQFTALSLKVSEELSYS